jgi:hypothetical protein
MSKMNLKKSTAREKKTAAAVPGTPPEAARPDEAKRSEKSGTPMSFDHGRRCPRCGGLDTYRVASNGTATKHADRVYRKCRSAICRLIDYRYSVNGRPY